MKKIPLSALNESYELIMGALCIWREARGEPREGKVAVWNVIKNRVASKRWGPTITRVVTARWQFSAFNDGDPNTTKFPAVEDVAWQECLEVVIGNGAPDITQGAMFYFNPKIVMPPWSRTMIKTGSFGNHDFYREA